MKCQFWLLCEGPFLAVAEWWEDGNGYFNRVEVGGPYSKIIWVKG